MPTKPKYKVIVTRLTENGAFVYGGCETFSGIATFTPTYTHCELGILKLVKIKGGEKGGNYRGAEDHEVYRVMKGDKL